MSKDKYIDILGYKVFAGTKNEALENVFNRDKVHIISGNPEVLYTGLHQENLFKNFTSDKAFIIPDGVGTQISAKVLQTSVEEKIAGIELMKDIIYRCENEGKGIYLLGASEESLEACIANLMVKYPKLNILGYKNGFFDLDNADDVLNEIKELSPFAIFVAMGCPRQEKFIVKYMDELPCRIFMGVGGSFDVIGDKVKRAPKWMINIGMEWAYRVIKEPFRIKRLSSIPKFIGLVVKSKGVNDEVK